MKTIEAPIVLAGVSLMFVTAPAAGHSQLATALKAKYELRSVTCTACHLKEQKERSIKHLTLFGKDIARILEGKNVSERIEAAKDLDSAERKKVLETIEKEYVEALKKLDKMKAHNDKLYEVALPAGDIEGTRPR